MVIPEDGDRERERSIKETLEDKMAEKFFKKIKDIKPHDLEAHKNPKKDLNN